jgi:biopolymer transport protein ExbD
MAKKRKREDPGSVAQLPLTAMIDCTFLLLIFFMLATKFKTVEGRLKAYLPKDRGQGIGTPTVDLGEMRVKLLWCRPKTRIEFRKRVYGENFATYYEEVKNGQVVLKVEKKYFPSRKGPKNQYWPDYGMLHSYIKRAKADYRPPSFDRSKKMPLIIDAREAVPWKHVVMVLNMALKAGLYDITFAAPEVPY